MRQKPSFTPEQAMKEVQKIFKQRGTEALKMARKEILQEEFKSNEVRDALHYFMTQYWKDLARPTLLSLTCEAVGGKPERTLPIAVPMILISGGIDIHDDIIDDSRTKANRLTVYGKFGKDIALVAGDILLFKGLSLIGQSMEKGVSAVKLPTIIGIIQKLFFELADAEALEYQCRAKVDTPPESYLKVLWRKAADVEAHTKMGAIIGGGTEIQVRELSQYGRLLGMLVLLRDDWLDTLDPEELGHRLKKECPPLPVLYAAQDPQTKDRILSILRNKSLAKIYAERILTLVQPRGFENAERFMAKTYTKAYSCLQKARCEETYLKLFVVSQLPSSREMRELTTTRS